MAAHSRHDPRWSLEGAGPDAACLACVIEMTGERGVPAVRKKHVLSVFRACLEKNPTAVSGLLLSDGRICAHFIGQLLGMLGNTEDAAALDLIIDALVHLTSCLKQKVFIHCVLGGCQQELSEASSMRISLPVFTFLGKLLHTVPDLAEILVTDHCFLREVLNCDQFVAVMMSFSSRSEDSEAGSAPQASALPLILKKMLISRDEVLQIASAQCIAAVLVQSTACYAPAFILADIPEFLFENLLNRNELLVWSVYCCLLLMSEESLFFMKGHTAYGIEAILRSLDYVFQLNNMELQRQGLLLLTEILYRQPADIRLFTNPGSFKAAVDVLLKAVDNPFMEVATEATRTIAAFLRKDHLSSPVLYEELEKLLTKMLERCADLILSSLRGGALKHTANRQEIKRLRRCSQLLTRTLEAFHWGCKLALACQQDDAAQTNAFITVSSESRNTLQTFSCFLLNTCDNVCIPTVLEYFDYIPSPATMEIFFSLLMDIFAVAPSVKEAFSVKLANASFIRLSMEVKSRFCSSQRNRDLNSTCSAFLAYLCCALWDFKVGKTNGSQNELRDVLHRGMRHMEGNVSESLSVLLESPDTCATEDLRCHQQALIVMSCVAYMMEDRFIPETDLYWPIQAFLHCQDQGECVSPPVVTAALYLLACCQDTCEELNMITIDVICRLIENIAEVQLVYFHHPLFIQLFFRYPKLQEKYGAQILKLYICQEEAGGSTWEEPELLPIIPGGFQPIISILHSCPTALSCLMDVISSGSVELSDKGLLILKAFLRGNDCCDVINLVLNHLLHLLQDMILLPDVPEVKNLPLVLSLLCLAQQKGPASRETEGVYFRLLYHVSSVCEKCGPSNVTVLQPAFTFLYCLLHQSSSSCKIRAAAMLLSNNSLIAVMEAVAEQSWEESCPDEGRESLCCSAGLLTSTLISFQHLYALQVHRSLAVDVQTLVNIVAFRSKETSSMLMIGLLQLLKTLLRQKFSSPLVNNRLPQESSSSLSEEEDCMKPLTTESALYLTAAFQNLIIQKDVYLVRAALDCFQSLVDFLYDKATDLALHVAAHPWNRSVLLVSLNYQDNLYLQPGILRFIAMILNAKLDTEPWRKSEVQDLLQKVEANQRELVSGTILYEGGIAVSLSHITE
ncbi:meiosis inhibitor protein 1 isoform X2 [Hyperolius riggenbachi]|uniref:meiosis inhibitor protein 1 isoform X2 n=1 Tax=Hyperolius riggenbachi TaxID=752182 RepID=UPI0035A2953D